MVEEIASGMQPGALQARSSGQRVSMVQLFEPPEKLRRVLEEMGTELRGEVP